ncbi:MAG: DNA polymerase III subunit chi [Rhodobiaceae bacterium]|nr:DNA polymerase III subunit chi [Rhodobiaceae bacterium]MCC0013419.1 DNA polymerase III subunit chi [Rhodobiaceae bacterium]MCC0018230.1 DNA polymerase III subunit chi [Rhodobiaceae bacterium]MCC0050827.1 DNA polymerase III subunit chi [Rhodobiaceae bacterium]MCC0060528.1 DNA polymerase III subunit chi [Rhodobiaceae bacterium]
MSEQPEIFFYHLERQALEQALPLLVEKSLERGWKALVRCGSYERLEALDTALWTYREDSFLPHGRDSEAGAPDEPALLTTEAANPNGAHVLFVVDRAGTDALNGYERIVYMFDGRDDEALTQARGFWKEAKEAGHDLTYWQQDGRGRWEKKAEAKNES